MSIRRIERVCIDERVADLPLTRDLVRRLKKRAHAPSFQTVSGAAEVYADVREAADPVRRGKEVFLITENRGDFLRECPGTREYICCGYRILHIGAFCTMDCSYCILQSYFHPPVLQFFANHDRMLAELRAAFREKAFRRVGTGEFTDSLIWEWVIPLSDVLVPAFASQDHMMLELKTKTVAIDRLEGLDHRRRTAVSWSVNTERVIGENERGTASLSSRLAAAARCEAWGYPLAFHFDPMVIYEGCAAEYADVVHRIFSTVSAENILWISIGTFRFMPSLKSVVKRRFSESGIIYGEFITGMDEKMRYFKPLRMELYQSAVAAIRKKAPDVPVYFCMEDEEVWRSALGFTPEERGGLPAMLDESAIRVCGLDA